MKIGVVTYWYGNSNYGMIMQCWALQQYLKKMGHEPYVIRFKPERPWYIRFVKLCLKYLLCVFSSRKRAELSLEKYNAKRDMDRGFEEFRRIHLDLSERYYKHLSELRKYPPKADCYVAGSDQIWCSDLSKDNEAKGYYLAFGEKSKRRIAYAPSFGRQQYSIDKQDLLRDALKNFDYVSCREKKGVEMCKGLGVNAMKVVDPTFLLGRGDYEQLVRETHKQTCIFIYSVNIEYASDLCWEAIKTTFSNKKIVVTPASGSIAGGELFGKEVEYDYATPGGWLSLIKSAEFVITSSFHGVVFSVIFNTPFVFIPIKGEFASTNNRITDLLDDLGLKDRIVMFEDEFQCKCNKEINWEYVNQKRENIIKESMNYLRDSLSI